MKYAFFNHAWIPAVFMALLVLPVVVGAPAPAALAGSDQTDVLPLCSDPSTLQAVHAQLNEAPHVNVIGLHGAREVDANKAPDLRTCDHRFGVSDHHLHCGLAGPRSWCVVRGR